MTTRCSPYDEFERLEKEFAKLLAQSPYDDIAVGAQAGALPSGARGEWIPPVDMVETERAVIVRAELPGIRREDVSITIDHGTLTLQGSRSAERKRRGCAFLCHERRHGSFHRALALPTAVDARAVRIRFVDGVLTLVLPKSTR